MKTTFESGIHAVVEKTQDRQVHPPPHHPPPMDEPSHPSSHRQVSLHRQHHRPRSSQRSRSCRHGSPPSKLDKRPLSTRRSPRIHPSRRRRQSSRDRSTSRDPFRSRDISHRRDRDSSISLSVLLRLIAEETRPTLTITTTSPTILQDHLYSMLPKGGKNSIPQMWMTCLKSPTIKISTTDDSGNNGVNGSLIPTIPIPIGTQPGTTTAPSSIVQGLNLPMLQNPDPSRHSPLHILHTNIPREEKNRSFNDDQSHGSITLPTGHMPISLQDGSKDEWVTWVKFGLRHPDRMKATSEIPQSEQPKPNNTVDIDQFQQAVTFLHGIDRRIPPVIAKKAISLISSENLLHDISLERAHIVELKFTHVLALVFPLPDTSRFSMPFKQAQNHTWALIHGTPMEAARNILLEGCIRPANWSHNKDHSKCDVPTFGAFYLGREISKTDSFPEWASKELMGSAQKRGKGQQEVLIGAMYRGASAHISFKAGGNETAQIAVADRGIATTSEKYTIAHSNHVGLKFFALKWQNLPMPDEDDRSTSEDLTYRGINKRTDAKYSGTHGHRKPASRR